MNLKAFYEGKVVTVHLSGKNRHGEPYADAGYQRGYIMKARKKVHGRVVYLSGAWHFERKD